MSRQKYGRWYSIIDLLLRHENRDLPRMLNQIDDNMNITCHVLNISQDETVPLTNDILQEIIRLVKLFAKQSRKQRNSLKFAAREMIHEVFINDFFLTKYSKVFFSFAGYSSDYSGFTRTLQWIQMERRCNRRMS